MEKGQERRFVKIAIILIAVFLCLPCSAKAEIKTKLSIPPIEITGKNYQFSVCNTAVFSTESRNLISVIHKKQLIQQLLKHFDAFQIDVKFLKQRVTFLEIKLTSDVPTYILHEQYRI